MKVKNIPLLVALLLFHIPVSFSLALSDDSPILVGHIVCVEGEVSRYDAEEQEWIAIENDFPVGEGDIFASTTEGKAELLFPNNTRIRIGGDTQIRLIKLDHKITEFDLEGGVVRVDNLSKDTVIWTNTPFGVVNSSPGTTFDGYLNESSIEIVAEKGRVTFIHSRDNSRYEVVANSSSLIVDSQRVIAGEGRGDREWISWNRKRDNYWAKKEREGSQSYQYLPEQLYNEAYALDEWGRWEEVYYGGRNYYFWRPIYVSKDWSPFTVGRWFLWFGDYTWIPYEPFGYVTHHYGNWVWVGGLWYWAPPLPNHSAWLRISFLDIPFGWYPGRVAWVDYPNYIGWIPLAPFEPYYCHHHWGPHTIVVNNIRVINVQPKPKQYQYFDRAIVIDRNHFHKVRNYATVRIKNNPYEIAHNVLPERSRDYRLFPEDKEQREQYSDKSHYLKPEEQGPKNNYKLSPQNSDLQREEKRGATPGKGRGEIKAHFTERETYQKGESYQRNERYQERERYREKENLPPANNHWRGDNYPGKEKGYQKGETPRELQNFRE